MLLSLVRKNAFPTKRTDGCVSNALGLYTSATSQSNVCNACLLQVMAEWIHPVNYLMNQNKKPIRFEFACFLPALLLYLIAFSDALF